MYQTLSSSTSVLKYFGGERVRGGSALRTLGKRRTIEVYNTEGARSTLSITIQHVTLVPGQQAQHRAAGACISSSLESRLSA